jgi:hypothetical protein
MEDIADGAPRVPTVITSRTLAQMTDMGDDISELLIHQYALNAQRGDSQGMTKVLEAQTKINATPNI